MEITNRNFFRLIADGTFGSHNDIEPMSAYKWEHLVLIGEAENLLPFLKKGINIHQKDNCLNHHSWHNAEGDSLYELLLAKRCPHALDIRTHYYTWKFLKKFSRNPDGTLHIEK